VSYESKSISDAIEEINRTYFLPVIQREGEKKQKHEKNK
jgi:hypothetical protein